MELNEEIYKKFAADVRSGASVYYVSVTSEIKFELALKTNTWGVPDSHKSRIQEVQDGNYVLFFGSKIGLYIFKLASKSYYDETKIWDGENSEKYPYRVKLEEPRILYLNAGEFSTSDMLGVLVAKSGKKYENNNAMGLSLKGLGGSFRKLEQEEVQNLLTELDTKLTQGNHTFQAINIDNAVEKIKEVYEKLDHETRKKRDSEREYVLNIYGKKFNPENISQLEFTDLSKFSNIKENKHWTGIDRQIGNIEKNNTIENVRKYLALLLDETTDVQLRLQEADNKLKNFGPLFLTVILNVVYPEKYCVVNVPAISALHDLKLISFNTSNAALKNYKNINKIVSELAEKSGLNRWDIDWALLQIDRQDDGNLSEDKKNQLQENLSDKPSNSNKEHTNIPKNIILYGPVGTGKTVLSDLLARKIANREIHDRLEIPALISKDFSDVSANISLSDSETIKKITFHQSYGYEEFIEGISAQTKDSQIVYKIKPGVLREICEAASRDYQNNYVLVIDEINRGEISRIFGELITTIEEDKRSQDGNGSYSPVLPLSGEKFFVPENLYIIGTMNNTDRSIALLDIALRRRFTFFYVPPSEAPLSKWLESANPSDPEFERSLIESFKRLNEKIASIKNEDFKIGPGFFSELRGNEDKIASTQWIFRYKIIPLLMEYFYGEYDRLKELLDGCFIEDSKDGEGIIWNDLIFEVGHKDEFKAELKKFSESHV